MRTRNDDRQRPDLFKDSFFQRMLCEMIIKICAQIQFNTERRKMPLRASKSVTHRMIAEVSKGATALDDLWKGLKRNDLAAQLVLTFAQ